MKSIYPIFLVLILYGCVAPAKYKSSRKLVKEHICVECAVGFNQPEPPDIKDSKYEMEMRLTSRGHAGTASTISIAQHNGIYEAYLYMHETSNGYDTVTKIWIYPAFKYKIVGYHLDSVMQALKDAGLFTLPSQSVTKIPYFGANTVEFKNNNQFGLYRFGFINEIQAKYPNEELFKKYATVNDLFKSITKEAYEQYRGDMKIESTRHNKEMKKAIRMRKKVKASSG